MPAPAKPTIDPETGERVTNEDALLAILSWVGSYEGMGGDQLATLLLTGATDEQITGPEEIPADMLAGYRYALTALQAIRREQEENAAVAALRHRFPQAARRDLVAAVRSGKAARFLPSPERGDSAG